MPAPWLDRSPLASPPPLLPPALRCPRHPTPAPPPRPAALPSPPASRPGTECVAMTARRVHTVPGRDSPISRPSSPAGGVPGPAPWWVRAAPPPPSPLPARAARQPLRRLPAAKSP
eukprot:3942288-Pleurochrysis_carterae.AAC.1